MSNTAGVLKLPGASQTNPTATVPKDAHTIMAILNDMGVNDYEPKVIHQLLEFTYRYITDVLEDAKLYANHAERSTISLSDAKLAVESQLDQSFTDPPPCEFLVDVAKRKNSVALPTLKNFSGARLPPDRYCLSSINYRLKSVTDKKASRKNASNTNKSFSSQSLAVNQKHQFVGPQMIMATPGGSLKRKWLDEENYDM